MKAKLFNYSMEMEYFPQTKMNNKKEKKHYLQCYNKYYYIINIKKNNIYKQNIQVIFE